MPFKWILCFLVIAACTVNQVQAALPDISENDFNGHQGVLQINSNEKKKYLAVLAKKKILIDQIRYKQQKILSLKSKKILLKYFRKKHSKKIDMALHHLSPVKYWERDNYAYLISIIKEGNIELVLSTQEEASQSLNENTALSIQPILNKSKIDEN